MTKSLKVALCASLLLGSVSTGFAYEDPIDQALEQLFKPAQDVIVDQTQKVIESEEVQEAVASATETMAQKAGELADTAKSGLKDAGNAIYEKGAECARWAQDGASKLYNAALEQVERAKGSEAYKKVEAKASEAYNALSDKVGQIKTTQAYKKAVAKATEALKWAEGKTPDQIKVWVENHPYLAVTGVITPIALYIGYKIAKPKSAKDQGN